MSSEQEFGKFRNVIKGKSSWHSTSMVNAKRNGLKASNQVEFVILDFGGEGEDIYEINYVWLR